MPKRNRVVPNAGRTKIVLNRPASVKDKSISLPGITETEKERDLTPEQRRALQLYFESAGRITQKLEKIAGPRGWLDGGKFSQDQARRLREKIARGFLEWAIGAMGDDFERYLAEGEKTFLYHFVLRIFGIYGRYPRDKYHFWESFEKNRFTVPPKLSRKAFHPTDLWPIRNKYKIACAYITKIPPSTRRAPGPLSYGTERSTPRHGRQTVEETGRQGKQALRYRSGVCHARFAVLHRRPSTQRVSQSFSQ